MLSPLVSHIIPLKICIHFWTLANWRTFLAKSKYARIHGHCIFSSPKILYISSIVCSCSFPASFSYYFNHCFAFSVKYFNLIRWITQFLKYYDEIGNYLGLYKVNWELKKTFKRLFYSLSPLRRAKW